MGPHEFNLRRWAVTGLFAILAIAAYVVGFRVTQVDPIKLITSLPKSQKILVGFQWFLPHFVRL